MKKTSKQVNGSRLFWDKRAEIDHRFKKVEAQYKAYLNEWKEKIHEAHMRGAVKRSQCPDWLPYHVKHIKDAD